MLANKNVLKFFRRGGVLLLIFLFGAPASAQDKCTTELGLAEQKYQEGRLEEAMALAQNCLAKPNLTLVDGERAYKLLGKAYFADGDSLQARLHLKKLLVLKPDWQPDPVNDTPSFQKLAEQVIAEVGRMRQQAKPTTPPPIKKPSPKKPVPAVQRSNTNAILLSAVFPGLGQVYKGQKGKAILFGATEVATLVFMFSSRSEYNDAKNQYGQLRREYENLTTGTAAQFDAAFTKWEQQQERANRAGNKAKLAAGIAAGVWALNILDSALSSPLAGGQREIRLNRNGAVLFPEMRVHHDDGVLLYSAGARITF